MKTPGLVKKVMLMSNVRNVEEVNVVLREILYIILCVPSVSNTNSVQIEIKHCPPYLAASLPFVKLLHRASLRNKDCFAKVDFFGAAYCC